MRTSGCFNGNLFLTIWAFLRSRCRSFLFLFTGNLIDCLNDQENHQCNQQELREDFINEGKREGKREGRQEGRRAQQCYTIEMMLNKNYDLAEICSIEGCDPALVEKVREKKGGKGGN